MEKNEQVIARTVREILEKNGFGSAADTAADVTHMTADITLDFAEVLMKKVEQEAKNMGMRVVTAVSDSHGNPVAVRCMDDAYIGSYDVALNKTYTAIAFKMSTEELGKLAAPGAELYGIQHTNKGRIVIFGGGVPLKVNGRIIGAFGVSGGSAAQDTYLAHFAEKTFSELTGQQ